jgi:hypothetical protein
MKKGSEWFKLLSEKEQQEFKENCVEFDKVMATNYWGFNMFMWFCGFFWNETPQGLEYWNKIAKRHK